jgi:nicotinate-nucleotide pyrophosphorylase (carboxylating)
VRAIVRNALDEDRAAYDVTTAALVPPAQLGQAFMVMREPGVVCGLTVAATAFGMLDSDTTLTPQHADGDWVEAGGTVARIDGALASMLSAERVALNLVQRLSGIATIARHYVDAARSSGGAARIVDTRKTTPGLRVLERYAVRAGGANNHRDNLQDGVLIKDNHLEAARRRGLSIADVIAAARDSAAHTLRVEMEADTERQAMEAMAAGADVLLLDNMSTDTMARIAAAAPPHVLLEASGGITLERISEIAASGVHLISSGALTHSAPALDVGLDMHVLDGEHD